MADPLSVTVLILVLLALAGVIAVNIQRGKQGKGTSSDRSENADNSVPNAGISSVAASYAADQNGIPGETVAAIAAAVCAVMSEQAPGVPYAITGIRRSRGGERPAWALAGVLENTRPF